jgi:hypothetical protein
MSNKCSARQRAIRNVTRETCDTGARENRENTPNDISSQAQNRIALMSQRDAVVKFRAVLLNVSHRQNQLTKRFKFSGC